MCEKMKCNKNEETSTYTSIFEKKKYVHFKCLVYSAILYWIEEI